MTTLHLKAATTKPLVFSVSISMNSTRMMPFIGYSSSSHLTGSNALLYSLHFPQIIYFLLVSLSVSSKPMIQTNPMSDWIRIPHVGHMYVSLLCCKLPVYCSNRSTPSHGLREALLIVYLSLNNKRLRQFQWVSVTDLLLLWQFIHLIPICHHWQVSPLCNSFHVAIGCI